MAAVPPVTFPTPPKEAPKPTIYINPQVLALRDKLRKLAVLFPDRTYNVSYEQEKSSPTHRYEAGSYKHIRDD